jgi:hypothetical protein
MNLVEKLVCMGKSETCHTSQCDADDVIRLLAGGDATWLDQVDLTRAHEVALLGAKGLIQSASRAGQHERSWLPNRQ